MEDLVLVSYVLVVLTVPVAVYSVYLLIVYVHRCVRGRECLDAAD